MSKASEPPRILGVHESREVTHYRVSSGQEGGQPVTVRIGKFNVFACLTCYATDCIHVKAVRSA